MSFAHDWEVSSQNINALAQTNTNLVGNKKKKQVHVYETDCCTTVVFKVRQHLSARV